LQQRRISSANSAFFVRQPLGGGRRRRQRRQAFTLSSEPGQSVFCISSFLFSSPFSTRLRVSKGKDRGNFPWSETTCLNRVGLVCFSGFLRRRLAFRWAPSSREAAYTSAGGTKSTGYFEKTSHPRCSPPMPSRRGSREPSHKASECRMIMPR